MFASHNDTITAEFPPLKPMSLPETAMPYYEFRVDMDTGRTEPVLQSYDMDVVSTGQVRVPVDLPEFYATTKKLYNDKYFKKNDCPSCGTACRNCKLRGPPVWMVERKSGISYHYWTESEDESTLLRLPELH